MKQVLQSLKTGETEVAEVPCPAVRPDHLLIRTSVSLVSAGTERMLVEFGRASMLEKVRQQPDKVKMVLSKMHTDGLLPTFQSVQNKLDRPLAMGYCNVGHVLEVGAGVPVLQRGDRVVSNGPHAEVVRVPQNLCAKVPDTVPDEAAAFTVVGAVGLEGIRLAAPTLGESFVVTGLGLIGLIAVQLLRAHGCRVLGIDIDPSRLELAGRFGAETVNLSAGEDPVAAAMAFSRGRGVDGVLIMAATKSNEPVHQAALMCRKRGRIVLTGVTGLELSRADFYEKELSFQVSCSYGPGRYDPQYETGGQDYPFGHVRWTAQRNFEAVLDMLADGRIDVEPLITHRYAFDEAAEAYELIGSGEPSLGVLLRYPAEDEQPDEELRVNTLTLTSAVGGPSSPSVAVIGAGNYGSQVLIPAFKRTGVRLHAVASSGGVTGVHAARKFGFYRTTTDADSIFRDEAVSAVVITTRHDTHAHYVCKALEAGKHVFVEKPLAITPEDLNEVIRTYEKVRASGKSPILSIGFNRRFAPQVVKMKQLLAPTREPKSLIMTVNAGAIPPDHWTHDPLVGGGRIVGEGCHFIDLLRFLIGHPIIGVSAVGMGRSPGVQNPEDKVAFTLRFADGSFGTVHYLANGNKAFPKERLEVFAAGRILQLDNFRKLRGFGWNGFSHMNLWSQDKGHNAGVAAFVKAIREGSPSPIPFDEIAEVTRTSLFVAESIRN